MRSSDENTILPFRNVFTPAFLQHLGERDEPPTAGEADVAGPWRVEEVSGGGFGVFRSGESAARGFRPYAVFTTRPLALLAAALLPGTGREAVFLLQKEAGSSGYAVTERGGGEVGHLQLFDEKLVEALNVLDALLRTPEALAGGARSRRGRGVGAGGGDSGGAVPGGGGRLKFPVDESRGRSGNPSGASATLKCARPDR